MSYNGSGTFLINTAGQPVVSGTVISSTAFNALTADLATGLSTAITKDGQTTVTANIPMGTYKFTGLGAGSAATDSANLSQVQSTVTKLLASVSGADTITAVGSPTLGAYTAGQMFYWVAAGDNTGAVTLNIDSLGAKSVTRDGTTALAAGDIQSGEVCVVVYDGTRFQLINGASQSASITTENLTVNKATVLNESGGNNDTRIEGDTDQNLVFVDASADAVGIGTSSPAYKLDVNRASYGVTGRFYSQDGVGNPRLLFYGSASGTTLQHTFSTGASNLIFAIGGAEGSGTEIARFTDAGNFGLGVTPSAWSSTASKAMQIGNCGIVQVDGFDTSSFATNAFYNGSWRYIGSATAARYEQYGGAHQWFIAGSGTAGNTISFTQALTLDVSGNLLVGTTANATSDWFSTIPAEVVSKDNNAQLRLHRPSQGSGVGVGGLLFAGNDGSGNQKDIAAIRSETTAANAGGGSLSFLTRPNSGSLTQAATLDANGNFMVGLTSSNHRLQAEVASGADRDIFMASVAGASNGFRVQWVNSTSKIHVNIQNLPTSSAGLPAGTLWNDSGTLKVA